MTQHHQKASPGSPVAVSVKYLSRNLTLYIRESAVSSQIYNDSGPSGRIEPLSRFARFDCFHIKVPMLSPTRKLLYVPCVSSLAALSVDIKMSMVASLPIVLAATIAQERARESMMQTKMPPLSSAICNALGSLLGAFFLSFLCSWCPTSNRSSPRAFRSSR